MLQSYWFLNLYQAQLIQDVDPTFIDVVPASRPRKKTRRWPNIDLMLFHRRGRWPDIKPTLGQHLVFVWVVSRTRRHHELTILFITSHAHLAVRPFSYFIQEVPMILGAGQAAERHDFAALLIHGQYVVRCAPFRGRVNYDVSMCRP